MAAEGVQQELAKIQANDPEIYEIYWDGEHFDGNALCAALATNTHVVTISLGDCGLKDDFAIAMAKVLLVNSTIQTLFLSMNSFHDKGGIALADALRVNTSVRGILIHGNEFSNKGARAFLRAMDYNSTLTQLHIASTMGITFSISTDADIDPSIGEEIERLCKQNNNGHPARVVKVRHNKEQRERTCWVCGEEASTRCSRCQKTWYCSQDCQKAHWPAHKALNCTPPTEKD